MDFTTTRYLGYTVIVYAEDFAVIAPNGDQENFYGMSAVRKWIRNHRRMQRNGFQSAASLT